MFKANSLPRTFLVVLLLLGLSPSVTSDLHAQTTKVKKVLFQGFWWDYKNDNFPSRWSNYLTELTPRLRAIGIDAVWIPPSYKNGFTGSVGYSPFDQYDLGDKYQKGGSDSITVRTRMGNKDELLRMIAVMHANGMEVLQDVVLNHVDQAGVNAGGIGGQDPEPTYSMYNASGYKNFRYVSYATPMLDESQNDYWTRGGRWPKNYANFYPYPGNFCTTGDICSPFFGPDIAFEDNAFGQSTNIPTSGSATIGAVTRAYVNPAQTTRHMRNNARNWIMWLKRQTGVGATREAEWAVLVADKYQRHGLGQELLRRLVQIARDEKLELFVADIHPENRAMQKVAEREGFTLRMDAETELMKAELKLV